MEAYQKPNTYNQHNYNNMKFIKSDSFTPPQKKTKPIKLDDPNLIAEYTLISYAPASLRETVIARYMVENSERGRALFQGRLAMWHNSVHIITRVDKILIPLTDELRRKLHSRPLWRI